MSTSVNFRNSPKGDLSESNCWPNGPGGKDVSVCQVERKNEDGLLANSRPKVGKIESKDEDSDFDCNIESDGKPAYADVDKEFRRTDEKLSCSWFSPNKSNADDLYNNGEIGVGNYIINGNSGEQIINWTFRPVNVWVAYHAFQL